METNSKMSTWIVVGVIAFVVVIIAVVLIAGKRGNPQTAADVKQPTSATQSKLDEKKKQIESAKKVTPPTPSAQPADTTRQLPPPPPVSR